jgi:hypothetical protein
LLPVVDVCRAVAISESRARAPVSLTSEAELPDRVPDRRGDLRVGVVGVDRRAPSRLISVLAGELAQLLARECPLLALLVEHLRDRSPPRPCGQHQLLGARREPLLALNRAEDPERFEVGVDPGAGAARRQLPSRRDDEPGGGYSSSSCWRIRARSRIVSRCQRAASFPSPSSSGVGPAIRIRSGRTCSSACSRAMLSRPTFSR